MRVIFFDAVGTLIHLPRGAGWHYADVARRHGCSLDPARVEAAFRETWKSLPPPPETRVKGSDDDRGWWEQVVNGTLDRCAVPRDALDRAAYFPEVYAEFAQPGVWELYPEVEEVLAALAPRIALGILSNFDGRLRIVLEQFGVERFFNHWIISSEVGAEKPSSWIFQHALAQAGVLPGEALHVGDEPMADWEAAAKAGLQVFRLSRPANSLRDLLRL